MFYEYLFFGQHSGYRYEEGYNFSNAYFCLQRPTVLNEEVQVGGTMVSAIVDIHHSLWDWEEEEAPLFNLKGAEKLPASTKKYD